MARSVLVLFTVVILATSGCLVLMDPVDGSDVEWRDPPAADNIIHLTDDLHFSSNDPVYSVYWNFSSVSGVDNVEAAKVLALLAASANEGVDKYSMRSESCLPSWIAWDAYTGTPSAPDSDAYSFDITIRPALQQVHENTSGDYWIWLSCTHPQGLKTVTDTFLIEFSVSVDWAGGVIVPDDYRTFVLSFDCGDNGIGNHSIIWTGKDTDSSHSFDIGYKPVRDGYDFKGWKTNDGVVVTGTTYVVSTSDPNVVVTDEDGGTRYTVTLHAEWEQSKIRFPTLWDGLIDVFSDPGAVIVLALSFIAVCLFIRSRTGGYRWRSRSSESPCPFSDWSSISPLHPMWMERLHSSSRCSAS